jgi:hypothetical protein
LGGATTVTYWSEDWRDRTELLDQIVVHLNERGWGRVLDSGWSDWDLEVYCHPWTVVQISTVQEDHGGGKRLIRVRYRLRPSGQMRALATLPLLLAVAAVGFFGWPIGLAAGVLLGTCLAVGAICAGLWWRGTRRAAQALALIDAEARLMNLVRLDEVRNPAKSKPSQPLAARLQCETE